MVGRSVDRPIYLVAAKAYVVRAVTSTAGPPTQKDGEVAGVGSVGPCNSSRPAPRTPQVQADRIGDQ